MNNSSMHAGHGDHGSHGGHGSSGSSGAVTGCHDNSESHGMMMVFHWRIKEDVLFSFWKIESVGGMIASVIIIVIMAAMYEGLKYYREHLNWKAHNVLQYNNVTMQRDKTVTTEDGKVVTPSMFSWMHCYQTFLHIVQMIVSYLLMLIFMTYNVWLCFGVVLGAAIGYFCFGWKKSVIVDVTEHCH